MDENALKNLTPQQKDELMRNVQAQVALANMQELLTVTIYLINFDFIEFRLCIM